MVRSACPRAAGEVIEWPAGFAAALPDSPWLVLHTLPRQEKRLVAELRLLPHPGLCFLERRLRHYPGKGTQESLVPLLGGYLFVSASDGALRSLYDNRRVVRILIVRQPAELAADLRLLCRLVTTATSPLMARPELVPGKLVTITQGTFAGCSGVVQRRERDYELVVNLDVLGQSVAVSLPADFSELASD